jgi:hypothetical protein
VQGIYNTFQQLRDTNGVQSVLILCLPRSTNNQIKYNQYAVNCGIPVRCQNLVATRFDNVCPFQNRSQIVLNQNRKIVLAPENT